MLSLILSFAAGIAVIAIIYSIWPFSYVLAWSLFFAVLAMAGIQILVSLYVRKTATKINMNIQSIMYAVQKKLEAKQQQFMRHPGNQKFFLAQLEKEQASGLESAIAACDQFKVLYKWNVFMPKQVNTMKMLFNYQLKRFEEVDRLLPNCIFLDSQSIAVKMARMYKLGQEGIDKFFRKKIRRLKSDDTVLPYALYAWILVKQGKNDEAMKLLAEAKEKSSNEVILRNWELLANGKIKQFSNAGLGDIWYMLALEEPKMMKIQQQVRYR